MPLTEGRCPARLLPLSQPARELLQALAPERPGDGALRRAKLALVFLVERGTPFDGWSKAKTTLDPASGVSGWWLHDLRGSHGAAIHRRQDQGGVPGAGGRPPATPQEVRGHAKAPLFGRVFPGLQRLGVRLEVTEAVLNHLSGSRADI